MTLADDSPLFVSSSRHHHCGCCSADYVVLIFVASSVWKCGRTSVVLDNEVRRDQLYS